MDSSWARLLISCTPSFPAVWAICDNALSLSCRLCPQESYQYGPKASKSPTALQAGLCILEFYKLHENQAKPQMISILANCHQGVDYYGLFAASQVIHTLCVFQARSKCALLSICRAAGVIVLPKCLELYWQVLPLNLLTVCRLGVFVLLCTTLCWNLSWRIMRSVFINQSCSSRSCVCKQCNRTPRYFTTEDESSCQEIVRH